MPVNVIRPKVRVHLPPQWCVYFRALHAILAAIAGRTAVERRPYRMGSRHLGGANWESRHLGGGYRTMMFNPLGVNSS